MRKVADAIVSLRGWRRLAVAGSAGAVSALALAPWFAFPLLWLSLPILVWLIDGCAQAGSAALRHRVGVTVAVGWFFGFGYFVSGLWWIGAAFLVDADKFAWLLPVAVLALPAILAAFWALGAGLAGLFWCEGWPRILVFAAAFAAAEWLRGHVLTGFPWNAFGYALAPSPVMMQSAAVVGLWGLTLAAFVIFSAPAVVAESRPRRGGIVLMAMSVSLFVAHVVYGAARLADASDPPATGIGVRIVQPAIPQEDKWVEENGDRIFRYQLDLSASGPAKADKKIEAFDLVIWPESAFPFYLEERPEMQEALAELLPEDTILLSGAARYESDADDRSLRFFNSVLVIGDQGAVLDAYDKVHLVPFGEYLPFQSTLESFGLSQLTALPGGFSAGERRESLTLAQAPPFGPLICYEIIFPGAATEAGFRPGWLLNVTNDAWYGDTPGPRQHFHQARLRAVEEGLPLIRAANSGISAIVDANGRVIASLGVGVAGVVDGVLPGSRPPTVYARVGDWIFLLALLGCLIAATIGQQSRR
jgi:apolipoprotein N-acyltransferase